MIGSAIDITVFLLCYAIARVSGRVIVYLWLVLSANLVLSFLLADNMALVATADLVCAAPLLFRDRRSMIVGTLFVAMPGIYWLGQCAGLDRYTTFTLIAGVAYIQWMVAGHVDRIPNLVAGIRNRRARNLRHSSAINSRLAAREKEAEQ